jgi:hypothetical protein
VRRRRERRRRPGGGLYKLNPVYPSLVTAWFVSTLEPMGKVKNWFQNLLFKFNLYRYAPDLLDVFLPSGSGSGGGGGGGGIHIGGIHIGGGGGRPSASAAAAAASTTTSPGGLTGLSLARCPRLTDKGLAALAAHPAAAALDSLSVAGCTVTALGLAALLSGRSGGWPRLSRLDVSGCTAIKGAVALPPLLTVSSLRVMYLPALTALTVQLPPMAPLERLFVSECRSLHMLHVSTPRLKFLNAGQCKQLTRLELHCKGLDTLILQHCSDLAAPVSFTCPGKDGAVRFGSTPCPGDVQKA